MKKALEKINLDIDPNHPPIFVIDMQPGPVVHAFSIVQQPKVKSRMARPKIMPILTFEIDPDAPKVKRVMVLIPCGGWIGEDGAELRFVFVNPLDGVPIGIYEVPYRDDGTMPIAEPAGDRVRPILQAAPDVDVPSMSVAELLAEPTRTTEGGLHVIDGGDFDTSDVPATSDDVVTKETQQEG